jgi:hypothetical protein
MFFKEPICYALLSCGVHLKVGRGVLEVLGFCLFSWSNLQGICTLHEYF